MPSHPLGQWQPCPTCCVGCVYESDNFDRADSTNLGAKWTETAGNPEILSNALAFVAQANAKATCTTLHPTPSNKYIVSATVKFTADGDVARVWIGNSGYFVELERITATCGRLRIYDNTGASPVCMGASGGSLSPWARIAICSEADKIHVSIGGSFPLTIPATVTSSIVAVGTAACTGTVSIEDFSLAKHFDDDATCPTCPDEACPWFTDNGCASGSLSATDWTATGTWVYDNGIKCTADGKLTLVPECPFGADGTALRATVPKNIQTTGTIVRAYLTADTYIELSSAGAVLHSGGSTSATKLWAEIWDLGGYPNPTLSICCDATRVIGFIEAGVKTLVWEFAWTPTTLAPAVEVDNATGLTTLLTLIECRKITGEIATCPDCLVNTCEHCTNGTYTATSKIVIAGLVSNVYGCPCSDITFYATVRWLSSSLCWWTAQQAGPCSTGNISADARLSAVAGGIMLRVLVSGAVGNATFEITVVGSAPMDCATAFDGDIPRVSGTTLGACSFAAATCTFTAPAP